MASLMERAKSWLRGEGSWRGPFSGTGELGGIYGLGRLEDGWQRNLSPSTFDAKNVAPVYACAMLYARAISQCKALHRKEAQGGGFETVTTSSCSRVLRRPNSIDNWPQLIFNTVAEMFFEGESLWLGARDNRGAVSQVFRIPRRGWTVMVEPETREVFYGIYRNSNEVAPVPEYAVPLRDVCHFRQYTPRHSLIGESPLKAAATAVGINVAVNASQLAFYTNMSRPSGVLTTEEKFNKSNIERLRAAWEDASAAMAQGKVPVLSNGLKFQPVGIAPIDSQLVDQQKMSALDIARVFGVPYAMIAETTGPQGATESLISHWLSIGLGSVIEVFEKSLEGFFDIGTGERVELDPSPLLRIDFKTRIEGLARAVQSGIFAPNEARLSEDYKPVAHGDMPAMQQQMVPLDLLNQLHINALSKAQQAPALPAPPPETEEDDEADPEVTKALVQSMLAVKRKAAA